MLNLAVNGYSEKDIINQLHAKNGIREVNFRYNLLNKYEIKIGELSGTPSGNKISFDSLAEIKRTANFLFKDNEVNDIDWLNDRVQPVFILKMPDGDAIEWPLGVFLLSSPTRKSDYGIWREIQAYDAGLMLKEDKFDNRYYIPATTKYIEAITAILNSAGIRKVNITNTSARIGISKEFEIGTSKLEAVNQLLSELNYTSVWVDENGYFTSKPYMLPTNREAEYTYKNDKLSVLFDGITEEIDLFSIPNSWVVVASNTEKEVLVARFTNNLPESKTSTVNRGRTITDYRQVNDILDQATLNQYVQRIAYESNKIYEKLIFNTALMPHHSYSDSLYIEHSGLNISSKYIETSWAMELTVGGKMNHNARRVVFI